MILTTLPITFPRGTDPHEFSDLDVVPFDEEDGSPFVGLLRVEAA